MHFLVTRPQSECGKTAGKLRAAGHSADEAPVLRFQPDPPEKPDLENISALAFSSRRAVDVVAAHKQFAGLRELPVFTVGDRTAAACGRAGFTDITSASGDVAALASKIVESRGRIGKGTVLYPAAEYRSGDLEQLLLAESITCRTMIVYKMICAESLRGEVVGTLRAAGYDGVLIYSRRTADILLGLLEAHAIDHILPGLTIYGISRQAVEPFSDCMNVYIADRPCEKSLLDLVLARC